MEYSVYFIASNTDKYERIPQLTPCGYIRELQIYVDISEL